eukprot:2830808-Pyramimonas_sp.AAC.1
MVASGARAAEGLTFQRAGKYLGVYLGEDGRNASWGPPAMKCISRAHEIKQVGAGLCKSLLMVNLLAFSVLMHVAQFYPPTKQALQAVRKAQQCATNAPNNSLPQDLLQQL